MPMLFSTNGTAKRRGSKLGESSVSIDKIQKTSDILSDEKIKKMTEIYNKFNTNIRRNIFSINNYSNCTNCNGNK